MTRRARASVFERARSMAILAGCFTDPVVGTPVTVVRQDLLRYDRELLRWIGFVALRPGAYCPVYVTKRKVIRRARPA